MKRQLVITSIITALLSISALPIAADTHQPQQSVQGGSYVNGGVGYEEAEWFQANAKQYALRLMFSEGQCGRSVTDVAVTIQDQSKQTVFSADNAGPQILVNLPAGKYKVTATHLAQDQGARFSLNKGSHKKIVLNWKNCVEEDSLDLPE